MAVSIELTGSDTVSSIKLTNGAQSIKEIYFADGKGSIFSYKPTKALLIAAIIFTVLSGVFYLLYFSYQVAWAFFFCATAVAVVYCLYLFSIRAKQYIQWKNGVNLYLKEVAQYEKQYLNLKLHSFEVVNDDETIIEKWSNIRRVSISPIRILLNSESGSEYLFPSKSMEAAEYDELKKFIRQKINDPVSVKEEIKLQ
ncbi:hypothetical protein Q4E93_34135 [Flavitalea sp. BT771]|uniref:hypothetical protein n=1 Tax=Flavitalea sp. BT771 TaxID=3063329 RepID=UPI0026E38540|nr:hypothetical protein [Flavitalea sp. BT771]MDO6435704.1 hypothetical protein [Flavitalea sp. BT771]MDV6224605.1 hypothetical protein [Flavitalea sp. BT771]